MRERPQQPKPNQAKMNEERKHTMLNIEATTVEMLTLVRNAEGENDPSNVKLNASLGNIEMLQDLIISLKIDIKRELRNR